jgi:hypothetical protein
MVRWQVEREISKACSWVPRGGETSTGRWVQGKRNFSRVVQRQDADRGASGSLGAPLSAIERRTVIHGSVQVERNLQGLLVGAKGGETPFESMGAGRVKSLARGSAARRWQWGLGELGGSLTW